MPAGAAEERRPAATTIVRALVASLGVETEPVDLHDVIGHLGANGHRIVADTDVVRVEVDVLNQEAFLVRLIELDTRARLIGPADLRDALRELVSSAMRAAR